MVAKLRPNGLVFPSGQKYIFLHNSDNYLKSYFW